MAAPTRSQPINYNYPPGRLWLTRGPAERLVTKGAVGTLELITVAGRANYAFTTLRKGRAALDQRPFGREKRVRLDSR